MSSRLLKGKPDAETVRQMTDELVFLRTHRDVLAKILKFGSAESDEFFMPDVNSVELHELSVSIVGPQAFTIANPWPGKSECTSYEAASFDYGLLGDDYANYMSATRALWESAEQYGGTDDWVVWVAVGKTVIRYRAVGRLSALRQKFLDAATKHIADDAGVLLPACKPLLIVRTAHFQELQDALRD